MSHKIERTYEIMAISEDGLLKSASGVVKDCGHEIADYFYETFYSKEQAESAIIALTEHESKLYGYQRSSEEYVIMEVVRAVCGAE